MGWFGGIRSGPSLADLIGKISGWDGRELPRPACAEARRSLHEHLKNAGRDRASELEKSVAVRNASQREAAKLRLIKELGRTLICFQPDAEELNKKLHRLAQERTPTADRMKRAYRRIGSYPRWSSHDLSALRAYRALLTTGQLKARLAGSEIDAAIADPRWEM